MARVEDGIDFAPYVRAAGGVVWRVTGDGLVEIVLVHRPADFDDWTFPKGKREPEDESDEACALREVAEETGYRCVLGREFVSVEYRDRKQRLKRVRYWEMTVASGAFTSTEEIDALRWVTVPFAVKTLSYPRDREVLADFALFAGLDPVRT